MAQGIDHESRLIAARDDTLWDTEMLAIERFFGTVVGQPIDWVRVLGMVALALEDTRARLNKLEEITGSPDATT